MLLWNTIIYFSLLTLLIAKLTRPPILARNIFLSISRTTHTPSAVVTGSHLTYALKISEELTTFSTAKVSAESESVEAPGIERTTDFIATVISERKDAPYSACAESTANNTPRDIMTFAINNALETVFEPVLKPIHFFISSL